MKGPHSPMATLLACSKAMGNNVFIKTFDKLRVGTYPGDLGEEEKRARKVYDSRDIKK